MNRNPGFGVMIRMLAGGSPHSPDEYIGSMITAAVFDAENERVLLTFDDGRKIAIFDDGQSCCEYRHMSTDDDVGDLVGHRLRHILQKEGPDIKDSEVHETCFVEIASDVGFVTLVNHNEHNGYYGGFAMCITEVE